MIRLALRYAFEILKVDRVTLGVFDNNLPAYRCYKSAGFRDSEKEGAECTLMGELWKIIELEMEREDYFRRIKPLHHGERKQIPQPRVPVLHPLSKAGYSVSGSRTADAVPIYAKQRPASR